jgi:O-antigen/teichoic acid export membrane protein
LSELEDYIVYRQFEFHSSRQANRLENKTTKRERLRNLWENSPTARNILKVSVGDLTSKIFSFATVFLLIRGLSVTDYAAFTTFSGISVLFSGVIGTGINMAVVRFSSDLLSRGKEKPLELYILAIVFQLILYALVAGVCFAFPKQSTALVLGEPGLVLPLQFGLLAGLGMLIIQFTRSLYQAEEKFSTYIGILWLVQALIFIGLATIWTLDYFSFVPVAIIFVIIQLGLGLWILFRLFINFRLPTLISKFLLQKNELRQFLIGSACLIGYFLILNIFSRMDVLMLLRFKGPEELAVYSVAFQYYSLALLFLGSIHAVLLPKFSRAEMKDSNKQNTFLKKWLQWSAWLVVPIVLFDMLGKPVFVLLNGIIYEKAFSIFVVFSLGIWLSLMFSPLVNILLSRGEYRFLFLLSLLALIFNVACNILLIPSMGGIGAALVVILTQNIFIQLPILIKGLQQS